MFWKNKKNLTLKELVDKRDDILRYLNRTTYLLIFAIFAYFIVNPLSILFGLGVLLLNQIYFECKFSSLRKQLIHKYLFEETNDNMNALIFKKYLILKFEETIIKFKNKELEELKNEMSKKEPIFNIINTMEGLNLYIKVNDIDTIDLLKEVENKLPFYKSYFIENLDINEKEKYADNLEKYKRKNNSFELLNDNTVISNEINELITSYKIIEGNQFKLDINEKIELNKISNTLEKIINTFNTIKNFNNKEIDNNFKLVINELKVLINNLNQSIQVNILKDIKVLEKTLKLES